MKILLTGARGMVGRNLLEHEGAAQHSWDAPRRSDLDLNNFARVKEYIGSSKPDLIIHAAGLVGGIQANIREPARFLVENYEIGKNVLMAAQHHGVPRVVNIGSSCMYPKDRNDPLKEEDVLSGKLEPTNEGYALAKIAVARLAEYISRGDTSLVYKTLVPCNLYGRHDKFDPRWSHLIPAVIHKLHDAKINGLKEIEIWGDGNARREFMYAGDLAEALMRAADDLPSLSDLTNVGLGFDFTVNEYYEAAADVIGYDGRFSHDLSKPVGMARKLTDVGRASKWGWNASTSLKEGLTHTYDFYLKLIDKDRI
jgi:GDP-L-fucose synthase